MQTDDLNSPHATNCNVAGCAALPSQLRIVVAYDKDQSMKRSRSSDEDELENSPTRDPHHFAFPMTVRALIARRDNLKATITLLLRELTEERRAKARQHRCRCNSRSLSLH